MTNPLKQTSTHVQRCTILSSLSVTMRLSILQKESCWPSLPTVSDASGRGPDTIQYVSRHVYQIYYTHTYILYIYIVYTHLHEFDIPITTDEHMHVKYMPVASINHALDMPRHPRHPCRQNDSWECRSSLQGREPQWEGAIWSVLPFGKLT